MSYRFGIAAALAATGLAVAAPSASAVPYASGIRNTAGADWEFVLNETADNVTILRNGANPLNLGTLAPGRHTFSMTGFTNFDIEVSKNAPKAWTELSAGTNLFTRFEQPAGLAVNKNPASPYFGTVYVSNSRNLPTALAGVDPNFIPVREMGEGIYSLTGDLQGVDLSTPNWAVPDAQDTTQAKAPNWVMDTTSTTGTTAEKTNGARSPWRIGLDEAGNLIASDFSLNMGGMKWATPNLTTGGALLDLENASSPTGVQNGNGEFIHSRIASQPIITGTLGVDLTVTAVDSDMEAEAGSTAADVQNIWKWNLGNHDPNVSGGFQGAPELVVKGNVLGGSNWITSVSGVSVDAYYSEQHDLYYLTQPRSNGGESSLIIVKPDGVDGTTPEVLFSSRQFSIDNELDGFVDFTGGTQTGIQDIFRMAGTVELSADGTKLFVRRRQVNGTAGGAGANENPILGLSSNNPESVLIIPLDEDGLPILDINDMGTSGDKTDDRLTDLDGFQILNPGASPANHEVELDAAGNAYITSNNSELLQVFSPGGNTKAITSSNGSFVVTEIGGGLAGDFNGDTVVDGADFLVWQRGGSPNPLSAGDLDLWKANFGTSAAAPAVGAVPEPSAALLAIGAVAALGFVKRRR
jgi:hypothetical protein